MIVGQPRSGPRRLAGYSRDLLRTGDNGRPMRSVLQYDPAHDGAKKNIEQAERMLKGLQVRQQK
jgi:hypothetical protein